LDIVGMSNGNPTTMIAAEKFLMHCLLSLICYPLATARGQRVADHICIIYK
jgi:hypothetical protein